MNITINPFQQLYFSDDIRTENNFVELFSVEVLQTAIHPVFQGGNVVLSGTQGCGKTMILNLLRPEIRIAYAKAKEEFPVNKQMRNFLSAGINLTRSRITDLVQITLGRGDDADLQELPFYFADFFNYSVVRDLIDSIEMIGHHPAIFDSMVNEGRVKKFVKLVSVQDCWFNSLNGVRTIEDLKKRLSDRLTRYRLWMNGNLQSGELPISIRVTKTNIGEPIARTAECLWQSEMVAPEIPVLIRVDQIEELHRAFTDRQRERLLGFRKMLNRAFAARDARVHYRMGTRKYGWNPDYLGIWGSDARLEKRRDYHLIQMDEELFALGETKNSIFERFAIDAFQKRVAYYFRHEVDKDKLRPNLAKSIFGKSPVAEERLGQLSLKVTDAQIDRALGLDLAADGGGWSQEWRNFLHNLYRSGRSGMLDAVLAAAWGRQTGGARFTREHREVPPPKNSPWKTRTWWRKERLDQAVLQLTARCQQRFMWWGFQDIRSLSGGNITVFLHICHRVWDGFLKNEASLTPEKRTELFDGGTIDKHIQAAGILFASNEWFKKLPEEAGGNARQSFAEQLGTHLNDQMMRDLRMAYPGGNGISLPLAQFTSADPEITVLRNWFRDAVGYGALFEAEHSSKSKQGGRRIKFYLNPILCPRFQLPEARTKEPYYWSLQDLFSLIAKAKVTLAPMQRSPHPVGEHNPRLPGF
jgi:hypothetical protein